MTKERKITGNIKGIVSKYSDNSFEFRPFGKGELQEWRNHRQDSWCQRQESGAPDVG